MACLVSVSISCKPLNPDEKNERGEVMACFG